MAINQIKPNHGYLGPEPTRWTQDVMIIDNQPHRIYTLVVHEFMLGAVDDVEIYASQPIWEWQQTDMGKWVMSKAVEPPCWHRQNDFATYQQRFVITAKLKEKDVTFWQLKWGGRR